MKRRAERKGAKHPPIDIALIVAGVATAAAALAFPWHVHRHPEAYGPPEMRFSRSGAMDGEPEDRVGGRAVPRIFLRNGGMPGMIDGGTVGSVPAKAPRAVPLAQQPFPGAPPVDVVLVANRRAIVRDGAVLYPVAVNSPLPDGGRVADIRVENGEWVVVTSRGDILKPAR